MANRARDKVRNKVRKKVGDGVSDEIGAGQAQTAVSRVERKRRDARRRIIEAAFTLMASRGVDDVTIAEITRHADVGHGTFYLHFKSKYDVLVPIVRDRAAAWDAHVQRHLAGVDDPAEVLACSARHMARAVLRDPLWHWFLTHSQVPVEDMGAAIGRFGSRDVQTGLAVGRFSIADQEVWDRFILGAYVSTLLGCADREEGVAAQAIDDMVELMLRTLGVPLDESAAIAHRPLQDIQTPDPGVSAQGG